MEMVAAVARLCQANDLCEKSAKKVLKALEDPVTRGLIWVQVAAVVDAGTPVVTATFALESKVGGLALVTEEVLDRMLESMVPGRDMPVVAAATKEAAAWMASVPVSVPAADVVAEDPAQRSLEDVAAALRVRGEGEGKLLGEGDLVEGKLVAKTRLSARVKGEANVGQNGVAWYTLVDVNTGNEYTAYEYEVVPTAARSNRRDGRVAQAAAVLARNDQERRLKLLADAEAAATEHAGKLVPVAAAATTAAAAAVKPKRSLRSASELEAHARRCAQPAQEYALKRLVPGAPVTGRGKKAVVAGLKAAEAFRAGAALNIETLHALYVKQGLAGVFEKLDGLANFDFVTETMIDAAKAEAPALLPHVAANLGLPDASVTDERTMMGGSEIKKAGAMRRIGARRKMRAATDAATPANSATPATGPSEGPGASAATAQVTPPAVLADVVPAPAADLAETVQEACLRLIAPEAAGAGQTLKGLKETKHSAAHRACQLMEWWRAPIADQPDSPPRHVHFKAWGHLLRKIIICSPSSASAERIFSQLKLCLRDQRECMLHDAVEGSMLLSCNDVDV